MAKKHPFPSSFKPLAILNAWPSTEGFLSRKLLLQPFVAVKPVTAMRRFHYLYRRQLSRYMIQKLRILKETNRSNLMGNAEYLALCADIRHRQLLKIIHSANCPPVGFKSEPKMFHCQNIRLCPFCFIRYRVKPIYERVLALGDETLSSSKLVVWRRRMAITDKPPFFDRRTGPHVWFDAHLTSQLVVPFVRLAKLKEPVEGRRITIDHVGLPLIYHIGIQVVPDTVDLNVLYRKKITPELAIFRSYSFCNKLPAQQKRLLAKGFARVLSLDWSAFLSGPSSVLMDKLNNLYPNQNLLRFQQRKLNGNH